MLHAMIILYWYRGMLMLTITKKQLADYEHRCEDRNNGRILTQDGLRSICEAYDYDPEKMGKHFPEVLPRILHKEN